MKFPDFWSEIEKSQSEGSCASQGRGSEVDYFVQEGRLVCKSRGSKKNAEPYKITKKLLSLISKNWTKEKCLDSEKMVSDTNTAHGFMTSMYLLRETDKVAKNKGLRGPKLYAFLKKATGLPEQTDDR